MLYNWISNTIRLGPFSVNIYGVGVALGILTGFVVARKMAKERGVPAFIVLDVSLYAVLAGIVGARVVFVLFDLPYYLNHPGSILAINEGGLSIHGGMLGGIVAAFLYCRKRGFKFWRLADVFAPALALGEVVGRIGCDVVGTVTSRAPFALKINGQTYHNVPLYSSVALLVVFVVLWKVRDLMKSGRLFWLFVFLYSIVRFVIEFFRHSLMLGPLSVTQVVSLLLVGLSIIKLYRSPMSMT